MPIGIFDSGVGGTTVLKKLQQANPARSFIYFGDNANAPYGEKPYQQIVELTRAGVKHLFDQGCELVILACNTASAVALNDIQMNWLPKEYPNHRVLGVFVPMIEEMTGRPWAWQGRAASDRVGAKRILLFATPATIISGAFIRESAFRAHDLRIHSIACDGLADAIDRDDMVMANRLVTQYCQHGLRTMPNAEAAVLGCTHYPLMQSVFQQNLGGKVKIISQPDVVSKALDDYLERHPEYEDLAGNSSLSMSGKIERAEQLLSRF